MFVLPENCTGCGACVSICPKHVLVMKANSEGFLEPEIVEDNCIECGLCQDVCSVIHPFPVNKENKKCFAAYVAGEEIRKKSSSGGIFSVLAHKILSEGGIVYGCRWSEDFQFAYHCGVDNEKDLELFLGSKYLQSDLRNVYPEIKNNLRSGRRVLFCGTPCQVAGLKHFLKKEYDNLYTVDVICHGVPSPWVWRKYLDHLKNEKKFTKISSVNFRSKTVDYHNFHLVIKGLSLEKNPCVIEDNSKSKNIYMQVFLNNLSLRKSCYNCPVRDGKSLSDITIGDFWGIENLGLDLVTRYGVSAVILSSQKGKQLWQDALGICDVISSEVDLESVVVGNPAYRFSYSMPSRRQYFMTGLRAGKGYKKLLKRSLQENMIKVYMKRLINKIKRIYSRFHI